MSALPEAIEARLRELPAGLRDHIERARSVSQELAFRHGVDPALADLGTAAHDMARAVPPESLLPEAERLGLHIDFVHRHQPLLLHGPVAAAWLEQEDEYFVPDVIESAEVHTTGRTGMSEVAKVVFLADKLDPRKVRRFPFLEAVSREAQHDLDAGILEYLGHTIRHLAEKGHLIAPAAVELRNELILRISGRCRSTDQ